MPKLKLPALGIPQVKIQDYIRNLDIKLIL